MVQYIGGLRASMGYVGAKTIKDLQKQNWCASPTAESMNLIHTILPLPKNRQIIRENKILQCCNFSL